jgi:hypothetical protein
MVEPGRCDPRWWVTLAESDHWVCITMNLVEQIANCFPTHPLSAETLITNCGYGLGCIECSEIAAFFAGKQWDQITVQEYHSQYPATSLMTQEAFNYFMPGWMTVSILDRSTADVIPFNLIRTMAGQSKFCAQRSHSFYGSLSLRQLHCVSQFIEWYNGGQAWSNEETKVAWTRIQHWIFAESARCDRFIQGRTKRLRFLSQQELERLTVSRLLAYRKKALSLESKPVELGPSDSRDLDDKRFIWFKQDPRWDGLYDRILKVLKMKQAVSSGNLSWPLDS